MRGTRILDGKLKKYEARYLQGDPEAAEVKLFMKLCADFRERWPQHPADGVGRSPGGSFSRRGRLG